MLRLTEAAQSGATVTLRVEGRMVGEWSGFLERHCRTLLATARGLRLDLAGLSAVDANGVRALRRLRSPRIELVACPPLILEMIDQGAPHDAPGSTP